jgi:hypothetical protein
MVRMCAFVLTSLYLSLLLTFGSSSASASSAFCADGAADRLRQNGEAAHSGVALVSEARLVAPGTIALARLLNSTSVQATFGLAYRIERFDGNAWVLDASSPNGPWPKVLGRLRPGGVSQCYRFRVPEDQTTGQYRFSTEIGLRSRRQQRTAEFTVGDSTTRRRWQNRIW